MGLHHNTLSRRRILSFSIAFRIWLAFGVVILFAALFAYNQLQKYIEPTAKRVVEDTLVDTAQLMARIISHTMLEDGKLVTQGDQYATLTTALTQATHPHSLSRTRTYADKKYSYLRLYITDAQGRVIYDSMGMDDGADYSQWNDVYLTLRGQYGARATRSNIKDGTSSVMYIAAPILNNDTQEIVGVVSVGKASRSLMRYLNQTERKMLRTGSIIMIVALLLALLVALWLRRSIALVGRYTLSLANAQQKPYFYLARELNQLTDQIADMKEVIENKAYVIEYVHTLTHELKSPLTAIQASSELLEMDLPSNDRQQFSQSIQVQTQKLRDFVDRLLLLAKVEQPSFRLDRQPTDLTLLIKQLIDNNQAALTKNSLTVQLQIHKNSIDTPPNHPTIMLMADAFWLTQALQNVLDNAIYYAKSTINIHLSMTEPAPSSTQKAHRPITLTISNDGDPIPDYALDKVFDRYFSLANSQTSSSEQAFSNHAHPSKKGTGLGLTLTQQIITLHSGEISITNGCTHIQQPHAKTDINSSPSSNYTDNGVCVTIVF